MWSDDDYRKRRAVRHSPTRIEGWLFEALDAAGLDYEKFATIGRYVPDAALPGYRVILEVDGVKWHRPRVAYDQARDRDLAAAGWTVMHFTDIDLRSRPHALKVLGDAIDQIMRGEACYRAPTLWREDRVLSGEGGAARDLVETADVAL
jgi:very-short-patch-repair endonuclease